jgi:hypothetical protein
MMSAARTGRDSSIYLVTLTKSQDLDLSDRRTAEKEGVMFNRAVQVSFVYTHPLRGLLGLVDE